MTFVAGWSIYVPKLRIEAREFVAALGAFGAAGVREKSVPNVDEDAYTMAVEAGRQLLRDSRVDPTAISCLALASCSMPYAERSCAPGIALALGVPATAQVFEHASSARAGVEALLSAASYVNWAEARGKGGSAREDGGRGGMALVIASEAVRGEDVRSPLEQGAGAGAAALLLVAGDGDETAARAASGSGIGGPASQENGGRLALEILAHGSAHAESLGVRFSPRQRGEAGLRDLGIAAHSADAYLKCSRDAAQTVFRKTGTTASDYAYFVPSQHDARLPLRLASELGFKEAQVRPAIVADVLGDLGAASPLVALAVVADEVGVGQLILLSSYGSGGVSDAVALRATRLSGVSSGSQAVGQSKGDPAEGAQHPGIGAKQNPLRETLAGGTRKVSFVEYLKLRNFI